ncbi:MAG: S24 family peptidase [Bacillota bacterium]
MGEFQYKVNDDSMLGDCIRRGDIVVIVETQTYTDKDILAIANEDDISLLDLRRVKNNGESYILSSSNPAVKEETRKEILVIGKITKVNKLN